jgi:hypothetical protein
MTIPTEISWHQQHATAESIAPNGSVGIASVDEVVVQQENAGYPSLDEDANNDVASLTSSPTILFRFLALPLRLYQRTGKAWIIHTINHVIEDF